MKVQIEKVFPMPGSADTAWAVLREIDSVAACMPGAKITERIDATHFKGTVSVKFGPASMSFRGEVEVLSLDAAGKTLRLVGKGTDTTGSSGAAMDLTARVEAVDAGACNLVGTSEVSMSGKAAAFGGRMMDSVADQVLKQFAGNFAARVRALQAQQPAALHEPPVGVAGAAAVASTSAPAPAPAWASTSASTSALTSASSSAPSSASTAISTSASTKPPAPAPAPLMAAAPEISAFGLAWGIFRDWLRSLIGARRA